MKHLCLVKSLNACFHSVDEQMRPTPVKVIRHVNGPSAWILSQEDDLAHNVKPPDPMKTVGEPSVDDTVSGMILQGTEESSLTGKQVTEDTVRHLEDEAHGTEFYESTKVVSFSLMVVSFTDKYAFNFSQINIQLNCSKVTSLGTE